MSFSSVLEQLFWLGLGLVIGAAVTFVLTKKAFTKQVNTHMKNNNPINEKMIRAMYSQMGRKPSEKQVRQVMNSVEQNK